jgi:putative flippase GtrA
MTGIWAFVKARLLTKKFLSFAIIGVVNTGIHLLIYGLCYFGLGFEHITMEIGVLSTDLGAFLSNAIAFIGASVFSYFANVFFTFKPQSTSTKQFSYVMGVFFFRLIVSSLMTWGFDAIMLEWIRADYLLHPWMAYIAPFFASAMLIPVAYFVLEYVFKKTDVKKN